MTGEPMYHEGMRRLQDLRETRALADRLEQVVVRTSFSEEDRAFIQRAAMCFIATADQDGQPDCSYKGGLPGFVRVLDDNTLAIPDYDGNGMYRTWGNVLVNPRVGLLFIDFEQPKRLRVTGTARIGEGDPLRVRGARHRGQDFPELPALPPPDAAGGALRARTAAGLHPAGPRMEDIRGLP